MTSEFEDVLRIVGEFGSSAETLEIQLETVAGG
jgi:hypothetical protein